LYSTFAEANILTLFPSQNRLAINSLLAKA